MTETPTNAVEGLARAILIEHLGLTDEQVAAGYLTDAEVKEAALAIQQFVTEREKAAEEAGYESALCCVSKEIADQIRFTAVRPVGALERFVSKEREAKDGAYRERDNLVCALSKLFPSSLERHPDSDLTWDNDWRWIVFIELPTGQATWHIHDSELDMFGHLARKTGRVWDGHTTLEKYDRLAGLYAGYFEQIVTRAEERGRIMSSGQWMVADDIDRIVARARLEERERDKPLIEKWRKDEEAIKYDYSFSPDYSVRNGYSCADELEALRAGPAGEKSSV